jgi:3-oxoacyl-(acyl-carrier-protein) synthase
VSRVAIVASGAVTALGDGVSAGVPGEPARGAIARDEELARAGLAKPFAARVRVQAPPGVDPATAMLSRALAACARELDRAQEGWRRRRVGLVLGTSSGGMHTAQEFFSLPASCAGAEGVAYYAPMAAAARELGLAFEPATLVLGACASATLAVGLGVRWLEAGACDLVLAGGYDAVSLFVAAGFESLRATAASAPPRPFRTGRDGMSLGDAAAVVALAPAEDARGAVRAFVTGFGASADAVHLTAPDRDGGGLARAAGAALAESGRAAQEVDLVSAHATATPFNDPAEARALERVLGPRAASVVVHPFKAQVGHTLGAAGVVEALACVDALARGVLPAAAGAGPVDPECAVRLLETCERASPAVALKLSSAFGGANAALVLERSPGSARPRAPRPAYVSRGVHVEREPDVVELAVRLRTEPDRLARSDALVRLTLAALAALEDRLGRGLAGAGIVVGEALATLETNALFYERIRARGPRAAEPRRFPYTSPNAVAGECGLAFGLTGPSFGVGSGMHAGVEAVAVAAALVAAGDADAVVAVATDAIGPASERLLALPPFAGARAATGAVAALVSAEPVGARVAHARLARGPGLPRAPVAFGHLALLPLAAPSSPASLESASPPDAYARVELAP